MKVKEAMEVLTKAMQEDKDLAIAWHCNIAMMCNDAIESNDGVMTNHWAVNDGARRFMRTCFDTDTSFAMTKD